MIPVRCCFKKLYEVAAGDRVLVQILNPVKVERWHQATASAAGDVVLVYGLSSPKEWAPTGPACVCSRKCEPPEGFERWIDSPSSRIYGLWVNDVPVDSGAVIPIESRIGFVRKPA